MSISLPIVLGQMVSSDELGFSLHNAAKTGNKKEVKKSLERGINVDYPNDEGQSPLFCACFENKGGAVRLLLSKGANPNERSNNGITPVHVVCYTGNGTILSDLLNHGGDLRLHDTENRGVKDWALLNPDPKKRKRVLEFLEKARLFAMSKSGTDFLSDGEKPELLLARDKSLSALARNNSVVQMLKARLGSSIHVGLDMVKSVQSVGFGKVYKGNEGNDECSGLIAMVPLINENQLHHDDKGQTFQSSLLMVMESMLWNDTQVTVKKTRGDDKIVGAVDLLINEIEYVGKLRHPNVLLLMGACQTDNLDGLVVIYERVHMGSLFNYLHIKQEHLSEDRIKEIVLQISDAMAFIHYQNMIHCSISSHAVNMINPNYVKIGNFEYMTERGNLCSNSMKSFKHALYNWIAPEIMRKSPVTKATDIYSFCVVIWEMFQGQIPWGDLDAAATKIKLLKDKTRLPVDSGKIPGMFQAILKYGLQLQPEIRGISFNNIKHIVTLPEEQDVEDYIRKNCLVDSIERERTSSFNTNSSADADAYTSSEQSFSGRTYGVRKSLAAHGANRRAYQSSQHNANNNFDNVGEFVKKDNDTW